MTGVRVALIHYWLVNWRGGERVLKAIADLFPDADFMTRSGKSLRQCVLSVPFALRFLLATDRKVPSEVLGIAYRRIARNRISCS